MRIDSLNVNRNAGRGTLQSRPSKEICWEPTRTPIAVVVVVAFVVLTAGSISAELNGVDFLTIR